MKSTYHIVKLSSQILLGVVITIIKSVIIFIIVSLPYSSSKVEHSTSNQMLWVLGNFSILQINISCHVSFMFLPSATNKLSHVVYSQMLIELEQITCLSLC